VSSQDVDFVVVGAGTAGCLLANRLSADPRHRVLLLEAGGADSSIWFRIPVGYRRTIGNPASDWCLDGLPEPGLGGRVLRHPRGKVLGGSSAINGMVAIRGQAADYDAWASLGLQGWGWTDVLPYFKRGEDHVLGASALHGKGGEWSVDAGRVRWPVLDDVQQAAVQAGIRATPEFNGGDNEGVGPIHVNQRHGRRWSAADGFLKPVLRRPNLQLVTGAIADHVVFDGRRAAGLAWRDGAGTLHQTRAARAVVLAAGAFGSPQLLLRSGVGPAGQLSAHGIPVVADLPGVGENLHDHLQIALRYRLQGAATLNQRMNSRIATAAMALQYAFTRRGPLTMAPCQIGIFARSGAGVTRADLGWNVLAFSRPAFDAPFDGFPGLTMIVYDLRPTSRGRLTLASRDAAMPPQILMNYLATERDRQVIVAAMRLTRRVMAGTALARYNPQETWPGPAVEDDAALLQAARERAGTIYHPVGTARMGPAGDAGAVVDATLQVHGLAGLHVIDASVMPQIVSGNTASPTVMIAEKGAAMLLA
jgi:choline dehydrogenase-like flavoprotein